MSLSLGEDDSIVQTQAEKKGTMNEKTQILIILFVNEL